MNQRSLVFSLSVFLVFGSLASDAQTLSTPPGILPAPANNFGNVQPHLQVVCSPGMLPSDSGTNGGGQGIVSQGSWTVDSYNIYTCPHGVVAGTMRLLYAGVWTNGSSGETDINNAISQNVGVENPVGTVIQAVTFQGNRPGVMGTVVNPGGTSVAKGYELSDPIAMPAVAAGGTFAIRAFTYAGSSTQNIAYGQVADTSIGNACSPGNLSDHSLTGTIAAQSSPCITPVAILGVPLTPTPSVCLIGHSVVTGAQASIGYIPSAISSGGTGATSADVGRIATVTGASSTAQGEAATFVIDSVNTGTGAVTGLHGLSTGGYSTYNSGQTVPSSPVNTSVGGGSSIAGLTVTTINPGAFDDGDSIGGRGLYQRALDSANIPFAAFTRGSDTIAEWATRDYSRLGILDAPGYPICSSVITELAENDIIGGTSPSTVETNMKKLWGQLLGLGLHVYAATMLPAAPTSTDGYATTGNQTAGTYQSNADTYNSDLLANCVTWGLTACFDVATAVSSAGKYVSNGSVGYCTVDGKHVMGTCLTTLGPAAINTSLIR